MAVKRYEDEAVRYAVMIACSSRRPSPPPLSPGHLEAAEYVGLRLKPSRSDEYICMICRIRLKSGLGLCRHLLNKHYDDIYAMIRSELERISSSYYDS